MPDRTVLDILSDYFGPGQEESTRQNLCVALGALATPGAIDRLVELGCNDACDAVRKTAAQEICQASVDCRTRAINRLFQESKRRGGRRSFELLQNIGMALDVPLDPPQEGWYSRVRSAQTLNHRLLVSLKGEFSLLWRLNFRDSFITILVSALCMMLWLSIVFHNLPTEEILGFLLVEPFLWVPFVMWPISITLMPPALKVWHREAPIADLLWLLAIFVVGYVGLSSFFGEIGVALEVVGHGGDLSTVGSEFASAFLYLYLPLAMTRLCLGLDSPPLDRAYNVARALIVGFGGAAVGLGMGLTVDEAFGMATAQAALSSHLSLLALWSAMFLCVRQGMAAGMRSRSASRPWPETFWGAMPKLILGLVAIFATLVAAVPYDVELAPTHSSSRTLESTALEEDVQVHPGEPLRLKIAVAGQLTLERLSDHDATLELRPMPAESPSSSILVDYPVTGATVWEQRVEPGDYEVHRAQMLDAGKFLLTLKHRAMSRINPSRAAQFLSVSLKMKWQPEPESPER